MEVMDGGKPEPPHRGEQVLVEGRTARVVCAEFRTHVFRGMISVDFGEGELGLVDAEHVVRIYRRRKT